MKINQLIAIAWIVSLIMVLFVGVHFGRNEFIGYVYQTETLGETICMEHYGGNFKYMTGPYEAPQIVCAMRTFEVDWRCATIHVVEDNGMILPKIGDDCHVEIK